MSASLTSCSGRRATGSGSSAGMYVDACTKGKGHALPSSPFPPLTSGCATDAWPTTANGSSEKT
eukprot:366551-Chlamydomonas_euryale.AAC.48